MKHDKLTSISIDHLRFPMAAMVVICHCKLLYGISSDGTNIFPPEGMNTYFQIFLSEVLPHIAVPMFAMFSGYLFFRGVGEFTVGKWAQGLWSSGLWNDSLEGMTASRFRKRCRRHAAYLPETETIN